MVHGICQGHAYTLLKCHNIEAHGRKWRLLELRNPWGKSGEWNGDWSDNDTKHWTDDLRFTLKHHDADDGVFFIPFEDYMKAYALTTICVSIADGLHVTRKEYQDKTTAFFEMTLDKDQQYFACSVNQMGKRLENNRPPHRRERFQPSPFSIIMLGEEGVIKHSREETTANMNHSLLCERLLKAGKYTFVVDVHWHSSAED